MRLRIKENLLQIAEISEKLWTSVIVTKSHAGKRYWAGKDSKVERSKKRTMRFCARQGYHHGFEELNQYWADPVKKVIQENLDILLALNGAWPFASLYSDLPRVFEIISYRIQGQCILTPNCKNKVETGVKSGECRQKPLHSAGEETEAWTSMMSQQWYL